MQILAIDTSGKVASVAISDGEKLLWEKSVYTKLTHSQVILPMVREAMEECEIDFENLDCVAVAKGPGSYTGLRIGIGAVKGMYQGCQTLKCAGVSTLLSLAYNCSAHLGKIISVMRARPKLSYAAEFISDGKCVKRLTDDRIAGDEELFSAMDTSEKIILVGDNAGYIKQTFFADNENVICAKNADLLQKASSICAAVENDESMICTAQMLEVSYLQATKAEKDKAHRN